jgi:crotonobetainyl-CoA:carnitine CoA-transferase CaiB-like acyl-CoA transferase
LEKALQDVRIVDLTHAAAGPTCTMMLAGMGADVIKVEPPWGEITRFYPPLVKGTSPYFFFLNRNKKAVTINLKTMKGLEIFKKLVKIADVVIENFRPGTMNRLDLSYEKLKKINPKIIYASISGFGQYGPYSKRTSFDNIAQASSGYMSICSGWEPDTDPPSKPPQGAPEAIADTIPGLFTAIAILAALQYRNRTGHGQRIDVSQADSMIAIEPSITYYNLVGHTIRASMRNLIGGMYQAKDGYVTVSAPYHIQETFIELLKNEIGKDTIDQTDAENWAKKKTVNEIVAILSESGIPVAPVNTLDKVITDPHFLAREMIVKIKHPKMGEVTTTGFPIKFSETRGDLEKYTPLLGEHNEEVFTKLLGYSKEEVTKFREERIT